MASATRRPPAPGGGSPRARLCGAAELAHLESGAHATNPAGSSHPCLTVIAAADATAIGLAGVAYWAPDRSRAIAEQGGGGRRPNDLTRRSRMLAFTAPLSRSQAAWR